MTHTTPTPQTTHITSDAPQDAILEKNFLLKEIVIERRHYIDTLLDDHAYYTAIREIKKLIKVIDKRMNKGYKS